ncbi:hypothetical protein BDFB_014859, partial [Asbolus verrucosus]
MRRNRTGLCIQFFHHLLSGLMVSAIFASIGNDAAQMLSLLKYSTFCVVFCTFTHTMIPILLFPLEDRFIGFCVVLVTVSYTSQALGYLIGSIFDITKGSIVGSAVLVPLIIISLY